MFRIVNGDEIYNEVNGKGVPVNISATRNEFTGAVVSYKVEPAGEPVELPVTTDVATIDEVLARFGCAEKGYRFYGDEPEDEPKDSADESGDIPDLSDMTVPQLKEKAAQMGIEVPNGAKKDDIRALIEAAGQ